MFTCVLFLFLFNLFNSSISILNNNNTCDNAMSYNHSEYLNFCEKQSHLLSEKKCRVIFNNINNTFQGRENKLNFHDQLKSVNILNLWNDFPIHFIPRENVSEKCISDVEKLFIGVENMKLWALRMLDSSAKLPSGILNGNLNQFGDFDQCLSIKRPVKGKYCLTSIDIFFKRDSLYFKLDSLIHSHHWVASNLTDPGHRVPKVSTIQWAVCLPASCSAEELQISLEKSLKKYEIKIRVDENLCVTSNIENVNSIGKFSTSLFFISILLCSLFGSILDVEDKEKNRQGKKIFKKILISFSWKRNIKNLLETSVSEDVKGLDGIRMLNALGLLISHKSFSLFFNPYINKTHMAEMFSKPWAVIGRTAIVYTDSFLLISGFLNARSLLLNLQTYGEMRFFMKLCNRLFRILPGLVAVVLFCTYILPDLNNGPQWENVIKEHSRLCKKNMWKNFVFIHNFMGFENMCLTHTHQLGIDMQLFLVTPLAILLVWNLRFIGVLVLIGVGSISTLLRFKTAVSKELSMVVYSGMPVRRFFDSANYSYIIPSHRATIYIMGILLAYFVMQKQNKINLSMLYTSLGWILATNMGLLSLVGPFHMAKIPYEYNKIEAAYYSAFAPIFWGSFILWGIWTCNNNCGGYFQNFMSWKGFRILSKISYGVYLIQFPIFFYNIGVQKHTDYFKMHKMIDIPEMFTILLISVIFTVMIEMPFINIFKLLFSK